MRRALLLALVVAGLAVPTTAAAKAIPACLVPRITGLTLTAAKTKIGQAHCAVGKITGPHTAKVISQFPTAGKRVKRRAKVNLTLKAPSVKPTPVKTVPGPAFTNLVVLGWTELETSSGIENVTTLWGTLFTGADTQLNGYPLTFSIVDLNTQQTVTTFSGTSGSSASPCEIATTYVFGNGTAAPATSATFVGQASLSHKACNLPSVTVTSGSDTYVVEGEYPGGANYAACIPSSLDAVTL
jgi:PASTA domain